MEAFSLALLRVKIIKLTLLSPLADELLGLLQIVFFASLTLHRDVSTALRKSLLVTLVGVFLILLSVRMDVLSYIPVGPNRVSLIFKDILPN
jgi:hypothetical protein